jgi:hypothetical protein
MAIDSDVEYFGQIKAFRLTSLSEDFVEERAAIHADQARFAKYGTNCPKKAALIERGHGEEARQKAEFQEAVEFERRHTYPQR